MLTVFLVSVAVVFGLMFATWLFSLAQATSTKPKPQMISTMLASRRARLKSQDANIRPKTTAAIAATKTIRLKNRAIKKNVLLIPNNIFRNDELW